MTKDEQTSLTNQIRPILQVAGVRKAALFGSVARGEAREGSDLDLLVELPKGKSLLDLVALKQRLEAVVGRPVDLAEFGTLKRAVQERASRELQPVL